MSPQRIAHWLRDHPWATSLILVSLVTIGAGVLYGIQSAEQTQQQACLERWADDQTAVTEGTRRLWLDMKRQLEQGTQDRGRFEALLAEFEAAAGTAETTRLRC
jgi:CHASE1-domain containing sensor protein